MYFSTWLPGLPHQHLWVMRAQPWLWRSGDGNEGLRGLSGHTCTFAEVVGDKELVLALGRPWRAQHRSCKLESRQPEKGSSCGQPRVFVTRCSVWLAPAPTTWSEFWSCAHHWPASYCGWEGLRLVMDGWEGGWFLFRLCCGSTSHTRLHFSTSVEEPRLSLLTASSHMPELKVLWIPRFSSQHWESWE